MWKPALAQTRLSVRLKNATMQPLATLPDGAWSQVRGIFTDVDDTLTTDGAVTADALQALDELADAGLTVIPVTGRPIGWSEPFARAWPVRAIVAENGAVAWVAPGNGKHQMGPQRLTGKRQQLSKLYQQDAATRARNLAQLQRTAARVLREVRGATLARDSAGRETDIAIDHSEFAHLDQARIDEVVRIMRDEGLRATVSSIHINGWIGEHDKWQGACWIARELLGIDLPAQIGRWLFVGDSTNDQVMFRHFTHSVGVANIRRFEPQLRFKPRYVTQGERGAGFAEMAHVLLGQLRQARG